MLQEALAYAAKGWRVFPVVEGGKTPLTTHGFKDATTDAKTITEWWSRWPNANIGFATGPIYENGFINADESKASIPTGHIFVIDVDPRNGGAVPQGLPPTYTVVTGGGGLHFYYRTTGTLHTKPEYSPGVDIKGLGGYVILPPSVTEHEYTTTGQSREPSEAPDWLIDAVKRPEVSRSNSRNSSTSRVDTSDNRPGTLFNRTTDWEYILEPHGWKKVRVENDETYWIRPGKDDGVSATTNYEGSDLLYVFTNSTEFDSRQAYDKFGAYAILEFQGNLSEAANAITSRRAMVTATLPRSVSSSTVIEYEFKDAFSPEHFIHRYVAYAAQQTDAPREYHEAVGLVLIATVAFKCSAKLAPYPSGLRPNLYTLLVGDTTRSRKSTSQAIGQSVLKSVMPAAILPNRATPEALINALAQRNGISSVWTPDEFGVTLAGMYNQTFMQGLEGLLLEVYAGNDYTYERSTSPSITIRQPNLSIVGAATPESIGRAGASALESGLLPRFAIVYPRILPEPRAVSETPNLSVERGWLENTLKRIQTKYSRETEIRFDSDALNRLAQSESLFTSGQSARLPTMLYKVALTSALAREATVVNRDDAEAAIIVVNRWKQGVDNLVPLLYRSNSDPAFERRCEYALGLLTDRGGKAPRTEIASMMRVRQQVLDDVEKALLDWGKITLDTTRGKVWQLQ